MQFKLQETEMRFYVEMVPETVGEATTLVRMAKLAKLNTAYFDAVPHKNLGIIGNMTFDVDKRSDATIRRSPRK